MKTENEYYAEPIIIERNETGFVDFIEADTPYELNAQYYQKSLKLKGTPKLSISILSWNNLESAKWCVESVLKYAEGLDYELVLMDNASEDDNKTYDYFQQVPYKRKKIIQTKHNEGTFFSHFRGAHYLKLYCEGDYILLLNDDHIVTENAIQNMVRALDSDPGIGMVNPMSSNAWNRQNPGISYSNIDDMYEIAARFNQYDPRKWEERIYIAQVASMFRRELLACYLSPNPYIHELYPDLSIRREGYRAMLLGDTWVHHNHDYSAKESYGFRNPGETAKKQNEIREQLTKHYTQGYDSPGDDSVYEHLLVSMLNEPDPKHPGEIKILGIDVAGGQALLDLKNRLRTFDIYKTNSAVFCNEVKYYPILYTVADEVFIDRTMYMCEHLNGRTFDYILIAKPINMYENPIQLLANLLSWLNCGGTLLFKLRNAASLGTLLKILGLGTAIDNDAPAAVTEWDVVSYLRSAGITDIKMESTALSLDEDINILINQFLQVAPIDDIIDKKRRLITKEFLFAVTKP